MKKKVNSACMVKNVLIRCGGAFVSNVGGKKYNKYKESTLCKGMSVDILRMRFGDYLVKVYVKKGVKVKNEDDEDKDEIKGLIWVNNHIANKKEKNWQM
ncbi:hypothetical protein Tco_1433904 [Tanacetum coccineum]